MPRAPASPPIAGGTPRWRAGSGRSGAFRAPTWSGTRVREGLSLSQGCRRCARRRPQSCPGAACHAQTGRGGRTALKDLGKPEGSDETIQVYDGPYGLYVKQGKVNASLPEGKGADDVTLEEAVELLAAKASAKKSSRKTTAAKKTAAKKPAAKKPAGTSGHHQNRPAAGQRCSGDQTCR